MNENAINFSLDGLLYRRFSFRFIFPLQFDTIGHVVERQESFSVSLS